MASAPAIGLFSCSLSCCELLSGGNGRKVPPREHIVEKSNQLLVDQAIRGQNLIAGQPVVRAGKVRHAPARLFHQQNSRSRVPRVQIELPKGFQAAASHVRQVERGRAGPPHPVRAQRELVVEVDVRTGVALAAGKSRRQQCFGQLRHARNSRRLAVQLRPASAFGGEELVPHGVVDHAGHQRTIVVRLGAVWAGAPVPSKRRTAGIRERSWWFHPAGPRTSGTRRPCARACLLRRRCRARETLRPAGCGSASPRCDPPPSPGPRRPCTRFPRPQ